VTHTRGTKQIHKYLCLFLKQNSKYHAKVDYDEGRVVKGKASMKTSGVDQESGFYYEYLEISASDVVRYFKNEIKLPHQLQVQNGILPHKQLRNIIAEFKQIFKSLDEIKPTKGKTIKALIKQRQELLTSMDKSECSKCSQVGSHLS